MENPNVLINIVWSDPVPYEEATEFRSDKTDFGIYALYGPHPEHKGDILLYIGRAMKGSFGWRTHQDRFEGFDSQSLRVSFGRLAGPSTPSNDVWEKEIEWAELLLIVAHLPKLNIRVGLGEKDESLHRVHVCNWGNLGNILPEVSGNRWTTKGTELPKNIYDASGR